MNLKRRGYVYILTNKSHSVIYTGVTNDLANRMFQHTKGTHPSFTKRYNISKLVFWEGFEGITSAIAREKQIKAGSRRKKILLIERSNPRWKDLRNEVL